MHGAPVSRLERARLDIVQLRLDEADDLWRAVDSALRVSAVTLDVERVGIWFLSADHAALARARLHVRGGGTTGDDAVLDLERWPAYRAAVTSRRVVAADDARTDARTRELTATYLTPLGIGALLDAPVFFSGAVRGVVCHEHVGADRTWTAREIDFAISVADMLNGLFEQATRLGAERSLRALDAAAARSRQIALVARTAAGIAHDVNTVLQAIGANAVAAGSATVAPRRAEAIQSILEDCQRGARILGQLRELDARPGRLAEEVSLPDVVEALRPTLTTLAGPAHTLELELERPAFVGATRTDLERILMNLVTNARDAAPRGRITIAVRAADDATELSVADEGPGVDPTLAAHVFEPYVTTKGGEHGLGLFVVQAIAERAGATVDVENGPGKGARFLVRWPRGK